MDHSQAYAKAARHNVEIARRLYREAPLLTRLLLQWRPLICPFEAMMPEVAAGSTVLDIGCGGGLFLGLLAATRSGIKGYGTDYSEEAIEAAGRMAITAAKDGSDATLEFAVVNAADGLPEGTFDVVSLIDVAHHLTGSGVRSVLTAAASRVAPEGGVMIYKDMAPRPFWKAFSNRIHDLVVARQWITYVPVGFVVGILKEAGLDLVRAETLNRFWYSHELRVFRRLR